MKFGKLMIAAALARFQCIQSFAATSADTDCQYQGGCRPGAVRAGAYSFDRVKEREVPNHNLRLRTRSGRNRYDAVVAAGCGPWVYENEKMRDGKKERSVCCLERDVPGPNGATRYP